MKPFLALQKHSEQIRRIAFINDACHLRVYGSIGIGDDAENTDLAGLTALELKGDGKTIRAVSKASKALAKLPKPGT